MKTPRILGFLITSVLATGAFATGENTVTSKSYVDAMDATKQDAITNKSIGSVATYADESRETGQMIFGEVDIYDGSAAYTSSDASKLITAGAVQGQINDIPSMETSKLTCANQAAGCTLWQIDNQYALQGTELAPAPACKAYGVPYGSVGVIECCSGVGQEGGKAEMCGCQTLDDCPSGFSSCDTKHICRS